MNNPEPVSENSNSALQPTFRLVSEDKIILHTRAAHLLYDGDWRIGRMGLVQFSKVMSHMRNAARDDDPYAEWYLAKIFQEIHRKQKELIDIEDKLNAQFKSMRGFEITLFINPQPLKHSLAFSPFARMAALLVEKVDYITRQIFTLHSFGLSGGSGTTSSQLMGEVQGIFALARKWRYTGVTRKDLLENNQKAQRAQTMMQGLPPQEVIDKTFEFKFL